MTNFYRVPRYIFDPIRNAGLVEGAVLLPFDPEGALEKQVRKAKVTDVISNDCQENLVDLDWWLQQKGKVDWVIAITQGMKEYTKWITECGLQVARTGVCVLDRLTFLEPTRAREDFLRDASLTNIKILSPRPSFRADGTNSKDPVTSAWFIFQKPGAARVNTTIDFDINWHRPQDLKL
jgi:hypothetical protein